MKSRGSCPNISSMCGGGGTDLFILPLSAEATERRHPCLGSAGLNPSAKILSFQRSSSATYSQSHRKADFVGQNTWESQ